MSVKRYEVNGSSSVFENENGSLVDYEDYAALEARCTALAAENSGLKEVLWWLYETVSSDGVSIPDEKYSSVTNAAQVLSETPATDSFLAEVRAQGVDAAIEELNQLAERSEKEAPIAAEHHRSAALYLQLLATQLRKGVQS
ncbi:hypothetical protein [Enterobacter roggenkampii]|uniref:hypothetical protein n=1 Tax=Enterobacter roggenkampii TaxID=1812935 RepID=UPI00068D2705|nr:hypothetical protein [Enterobacter roggenkampii]